MIITAAAAGIGRSIASAFVASGAQVQICDADADAPATFRAEFATVGVTRVDLRKAEEIDAWLDVALAALGGVDVLITNAGIKGPTAFVEDVALDEWRECIAVNLDSHFSCARRIAPSLKAQRGGSIINISSMAGLVGYGMRTPYAAAKRAVVGPTKSLAIEFGPFDARCNCSCPGSVRGDRIDLVVAEQAEHRGVSRESVAAENVAGRSIKRFVEPSEIADLCVF